MSLKSLKYNCLSIKKCIGAVVLSPINERAQLVCWLLKITLTISVTGGWRKKKIKMTEEKAVQNKKFDKNTWNKRRTYEKLQNAENGNDGDQLQWVGSRGKG